MSQECGHSWAFQVQGFPWAAVKFIRQDVGHLKAGLEDDWLPGLLALSLTRLSFSWAAKLEGAQSTLPCGLLHRATQIRQLDSLEPASEKGQKECEQD